MCWVFLLKVLFNVPMCRYIILKLRICMLKSITNYLYPLTDVCDVFKFGTGVNVFFIYNWVLWTLSLFYKSNLFKSKQAKKYLDTYKIFHKIFIFILHLKYVIFLFLWKQNFFPSYILWLSQVTWVVIKYYMVFRYNQLASCISCHWTLIGFILALACVVFVKHNRTY